MRGGALCWPSCATGAWRGRCSDRDDDLPTTLARADLLDVPWAEYGEHGKRAEYAEHGEHGKQTGGAEAGG